MAIFYISLIAAGGLLIDWACFERIMTSGEVLWSVEPGYRYRATLFPRVILTVIASTIFGIAVSGEQVNAALLIVGTSGFMASLLYAVIRTSMRKRTPATGEIEHV